MDSVTDPGFDHAALAWVLAHNKKGRNRAPFRYQVHLPRQPSVVVVIILVIILVPHELRIAITGHPGAALIAAIGHALDAVGVA